MTPSRLTPCCVSESPEFSWCLARGLCVLNFLGVRRPHLPRAGSSRGAQGGRRPGGSRRPATETRARPAAGRAGAGRGGRCALPRAMTEKLLVCWTLRHRSRPSTAASAWSSGSSESGGCCPRASRPADGRPNSRSAMSAKPASCTSRLLTEGNATTNSSAWAARATINSALVGLPDFRATSTRPGSSSRQPALSRIESRSRGLHRRPDRRSAPPPRCRAGASRARPTARRGAVAAPRGSSCGRPIREPR